MQHPPLQLGAHVVAAMADHARAAQPAECCGWLVGSAAERRIVDAWPTENVAQAPRRSFAVEPAALLAAEKRACSVGFDIVGVYHSHPQHGASPSAGDSVGAVPSWFYLIMGNEQGRATSTRVWRMPHEGGVFAEEAWVAV